MKAFIQEQVLPFALVCAAVFGSTIAWFGLPRTPPPAPALSPPPAVAATQRREDALVAALRTLRDAHSKAEALLPPRAKPAAAMVTAAARPSGPARAGDPPVAPTPAPLDRSVPAGEPALPEPPPAATTASVMAAVTSLSEAVRSIRAARTEEDFVRAEDQMRSVKATLQTACNSGASSAFCDSAREIGALGF